MANEDPMEKALEDLMAGLGSTPAEEKQADKPKPPEPEAEAPRGAVGTSSRDTVGEKMSEVDDMAASLEELLSSSAISEEVQAVKADEEAKLAEAKMDVEDMESALASALSTPSAEETSKSFDEIEETWEEAEPTPTVVALPGEPMAAQPVPDITTLYQAKAPGSVEEVVVVAPEKLSDVRKRFYAKTFLGILTAAAIFYVTFFYFIQPSLRWYYYSKLETAVTRMDIRNIDPLLLTCESFGVSKEKYMHLSDISLFNGDLLRALGFARKAYEIEPKFMPALNRIANIYLRQGRIDEAENQARQNLIIDPNNLESMVIQASAYFKKRDIDKAQRWVGDVLSRDRKYVPALELSRDIYIDLKNYTQALSVQQELTELKKDIPEPQRYLDLGKILYAAGQYARANSYLKDAYDKNPSLWEAGYYLAKTQVALGQFNLASIQIDRTLEEAPAASIDMYHLRALTHYHMGDIKTSIEELQRIRIMNPKYAPMYVLLGKIYVNAYGEYAVGLKFLEQARDLNYTDRDFLTTLGEAYFHLKRYREALESWKPVLATVGPTDPLLFQVSACLMHLNQMALAEAVLSKMYYAGSRSTAIYNNLGVLHELLGRTDMALQFYFRATQLAVTQNRHDNLIPKRNFDRLISGQGSLDIDASLLLNS